MDSLGAREFLMIPGPTPVPDVVLEAIGRHPIGHRTPEFSKTLTNVTERLKWLGETKNDVFVLTGSGTAAMEAAISNTINPGDGVLSLVCGVFGERWAKIAEAFGAQVQRLTVEPGMAIDAHGLEIELKKDSGKKIKAVTITHNETSTGVINDLARITKVVREHGALSIVDAVTSFAAVRLPIDEWEVDILVTGSQKALMLPPGLGIIFFGKRAWEAQSRCTTPRFYLDLAKARKSLGENTTPFTPNVSLVCGLSVSLDLIEQAGVDNIYQRHVKLRDALRAGLKAMGLKLLVAEEGASPTITSILPPGSIPVADIRKGLKQDFRILVADGQEALKGKIFRIGHMGYVFERDILMTLASLESVLNSLGHKCTKGQAVEAAVGVLSG
jgi:aspartate aminotransferase-like enzyme